MSKTLKTWEEISPKMFRNGCGLQRTIVNTKYLRIFKQSFSADADVDTHCHPTELEIILGGPKKFRIYLPGHKHHLTWKGKRKPWSMISIKIGKKS